MYFSIFIVNLPSVFYLVLYWLFISSTFFCKIIYASGHEFTEKPAFHCAHAISYPIFNIRNTSAKAIRNPCICQNLLCRIAYNFRIKFSCLTHRRCFSAPYQKFWNFFNKCGLYPANTAMS